MLPKRRYDRSFDFDEDEAIALIYNPSYYFNVSNGNNFNLR